VFFYLPPIIKTPFNNTVAKIGRERHNIKAGSDQCGATNKYHFRISDFKVITDLITDGGGTLDTYESLVHDVIWCNLYIV